jgi:tetratricopeptide (TPR) repeat protein
LVKALSLAPSLTALACMLGLFAATEPARAVQTVSASPYPVAASQWGNYLAALIASQERDTPAAAAYFRETLKVDPLNAELMGRAFASSLASGQVDQAAAIADKYVLRDPHNPLVRLALAARGVAAGQYGVARAELNAGLGGQPRDVTTTMLTAWAFAGAKDEKRALDTLDGLQDPALAVFKNFHAGLIADVLGDSKEAQSRLKSAYDADKTTLRIVDAYARTLDRNGDVDGAKAVYQDFAKVTPDHPVIVAALADLAAGKKLEPIVHDAREGVAETLYGLGGAGRGQGDELAPLIYLRLALYLRPDHDLAAATIADLFEQNKQTEEEVAAYHLVPASSPMHESAEIQAAIAEDALGQNAQATESMLALVKAKPSDIDAISALADLQRAAKNYEASAANYSKAIELSAPLTKSNWTLLYFRGICFERMKNWPAAEADFQKALELYPDQPLVLNYLGYSWIDKGMHLDEAFAMLRKAVDMKPDDGYIVDSLGWAHFKLGHFDEALAQMEKAIDLKASDSTINDHLGDVYWRVGRPLDALFQWNHARDYGPDPDDAPAILKKITNGLPPVPTPSATPSPTLTPAANDATPKAVDATPKAGG